MLVKSILTDNGQYENNSLCSAGTAVENKYFWALLSKAQMFGAALAKL
jgi:hypothetical protein